MASLNRKRLTRKEVKALVDAEGELDSAMTAALREERNGYANEPRVYKLSGSRYLYVFDERDISLPGKGDIYTEAEMLRSIEWTKDVGAASKRGGGNSVDDWRYYSQLGNALTTHVERLNQSLSEVSGIPSTSLDFSYKSLNLVSCYLSSIGYVQVRNDLYDHLVAYVGEVLRIRSKGRWHINSYRGELGCPCILGPRGDGTGIMMPINAVWIALDAYGECELRQPTINEYRNYCVRN